MYNSYHTCVDCIGTAVFWSTFKALFVVYCFDIACCNYIQLYREKDSAGCLYICLLIMKLKYIGGGGGN